MFFVLSSFCFSLLFFFFFNDTATTEIYTLSLHDALPISRRRSRESSPMPTTHDGSGRSAEPLRVRTFAGEPRDRKSTRLNSSHVEISYAVFCLKKKKKKKTRTKNKPNTDSHRLRSIGTSY